MRRNRRRHFLHLPMILATLLMTISIANAAGNDNDYPAGGNEIFGPQTFTRQAGAPTVFTANFNHCGEIPAQVIVFNGNADGTNRAPAAQVHLNSVQVVGPGDLTSQIDHIERDVILEEQNEIVVRLVGPPGSFITVSVVPRAVNAGLTPGTPVLIRPNPGALAVILPLVNNGTASAENVQITSLTLAMGTLFTPSLPISLGTISANGGSTILEATFTGGPFLPIQPYRLDASGTFQVGAATICFSFAIDLRPPQLLDGTAILGTATPVAPPPTTAADRSATLERGIRVLGRDASSGHMRIAFAPEGEGPVQLQVFDIRGRLVKTGTTLQSVASKTIEWDGSDATGATVASGIYLFRVHVGASSYSAKGVWAR